MTFDIPGHLLPKIMRRAQHSISQHFLRVPPGILPEHVVNPDFWAHLVHLLSVDDRIDVVAADGSFRVDLWVIATDARGLWAQMRILHGWPEAVWLPLMYEGSVKIVEGEDYKVEWGGHHRWRIANATGDIVEKDLPSKEAAHAKLAEIRREKLAA